MKNKKGIWLLVIAGILLAAIIVLLVFLFKTPKVESKKKTLDDTNTLSRLEQQATLTLDWPKYEPSEGDDYIKNITILKSFINDDDNLIILLKNTNGYVLDITPIVTFKDKEGNIVDTKKGYDCNSMPMTDNIMSIYTPSKEFESYDISFETHKPYTQNYQEALDSIELIPSDDGKNISVTVKNNGTSNFSPEVCVAYFLDDDIVDASCLTSIGLKPGNVDNLKFDNYYFSKKYKGLNFNIVKVFINEI